MITDTPCIVKVVSETHAVIASTIILDAMYVQKSGVWSSCLRSQCNNFYILKLTEA